MISSMLEGTLALSGLLAGLFLAVWTIKASESVGQAVDTAPVRSATHKKAA